MNLFALFRDAVPEAAFTSVDRLLIALRQIKTPEEVAFMERAADINDAVLTEVVRKAQIGMTEMQIAGVCEGLAREMNADIGSATVVMAGLNTNYAAWRPTDYKIQRGDFVLVDFNPAVGNYCNDGGITLRCRVPARSSTNSLRAGYRIIKEMVPQLKPHTSAQQCMTSCLSASSRSATGPISRPM